ncbi:hypothetical protein UlMin_045701 [Ulmus minor]
MIGCAVICVAVNAIVTPIEAQRSDPFQFRFCFTTPISHGRSKRFLSLTQRPKDNQNGGLANGFSFPFQCCKLGEAEIHKDDFVVVNFYEFGLDINGRIYINEHGINAQYSGPSKDALGYVEWLKKDNRFSDILVQVSPALNEHAFPKLKLRYKPSLVQFEGGISHLPLLDPSMKATRLAPSEWKKRLEAANTTTSDDTSRETSNTYFILLDVRNGIGTLVIFMEQNDLTLTVSGALQQLVLKSNPGNCNSLICYLFGLFHAILCSCPFSYKSMACRLLDLFLCLL